MTLWSDLKADIDNLLDGAGDEGAALETYIAYLAAPPAFPDSFDDLSEYTTYAADLATWQDNVESALADLASKRTTLDGHFTTILARIPVAEVWYTITRGTSIYNVGKFADSAGNYALRWEYVGEEASPPPM